MANRGERRPRTRRERILKYFGEVFLLGGIGRGVSHGGSMGQNADHMLGRAALFTEGARPPDDERATGLLDRVPGWIVLAAVALLFVIILLSPR